MTNDKAVQQLNHIGNELKLLWWQMETWQDLFDVEQEKPQALIQATAPGFFIIVQATLAESILMRIVRLMDPPKSMGNENSTVCSLFGELSDDSYGSLRSDIQALTGEWSKKERQTKAEQGEYASLKVLRNKWLAHNDLTQRQERPSDSLGIPLTHEDFAVAQRLAGRLWSIYCQAHLMLKGSAVLEPQHSRLEDRPSRILKKLCAGRYLDHVIEAMPDELRYAHIDKLHTFEQEHMGKNAIRAVFTTDQTAARCGTTGEEA